MTTPAGPNPRPRPALRARGGPEDGVEAARPGPDVTATGLAHGDTRSQLAAAPTGALEPAKAPKPSKKEKKKAKKKGKGADAAKGDALQVELPKSVRRALADAANDHGTTPERLASLVLSEWLDV